jgi:hypothetical protein
VRNAPDDLAQVRTVLPAALVQSPESAGICDAWIAVPGVTSVEDAGIGVPFTLVVEPSAEGIQPAARVPPDPAFGIALAPGVAVAISSLPPLWCVLACGEGAKVEGTPEREVHGQVDGHAPGAPVIAACRVVSVGWT